MKDHVVLCLNMSHSPKHVRLFLLAQMRDLSLRCSPLLLSSSNGGCRKSCSCLFLRNQNKMQNIHAPLRPSPEWTCTRRMVFPSSAPNWIYIVALPTPSLLLYIWVAPQISQSSSSNKNAKDSYFALSVRSIGNERPCFKMRIEDCHAPLCLSSKRANFRQMFVHFASNKMYAIFSPIPSLPSLIYVSDVPTASNPDLQDLCSFLPLRAQGKSQSSHVQNKNRRTPCSSLPFS